MFKAVIFKLLELSSTEEIKLSRNEVDINTKPFLFFRLARAMFQGASHD